MIKTKRGKIETGLKIKIKELASGNEAQVKELSRLLAQNMKELQTAIYTSAERHNTDAFNHARHRSKTALSVVGNGRLTELLSKIDPLFAKKKFDAVAILKNEIEVAFDEVIRQLS